MIRDEDDKTLVPLTPSGLKLGLILTIVFMVVSSPIIIFNPALAATPSASSQPLPTISTIPSAPSTIGQDGKEGDFTTQAALSSLSARPTNNIVNTNSFYDVVFLAATSGTIKTIEVTFPAGTTIPSGAFFNEAEGIGPGTASKSGQTIIYTVTNAVNVPAGTKIRLEFANINNPLNPSSAYQATVTTRNAANAIIDGPTPSTAYTMKQIGVNAIADGAVTNNKLGPLSVTNDKLASDSVTNFKIAPFSITNDKLVAGSVTNDKIADGSITSTKPAESFMKRVTVLDNTAGNAVGWNPDGVTTVFAIFEPDISGNPRSPFFIVSVTQANGSPTATIKCTPDGVAGDTFQFICDPAPQNGFELQYVVGNLPEHTVGG